MSRLGIWSNVIGGLLIGLQFMTLLGRGQSYTCVVLERELFLGDLVVAACVTIGPIVLFGRLLSESDPITRVRLVIVVLGLGFAYLSYFTHPFVRSERAIDRCVAIKLASDGLGPPPNRAFSITGGEGAE